MTEPVKPKRKMKAPVTGAERKAGLEAKRAADAAKPPKKNGRPSMFTEEICEEILRRLEDGENLSNICKDAHLPERWSVNRHARTNPSFGAALMRARQTWALVKMDEMMEIAWDDCNDWEFTKFCGKEQLRVNREAVDLSKLKVSVLQWIMARMNARMFSDDATKLGPDNSDAAEAIKQDATVMAPDEPGPSDPVL